MLPVGHVLNQTYRIERLLGQGGMAAVYVASHTRLPRQFALKIILANLQHDQSLTDRFRREAEILAALNHPNIVNVVDWNIYDGQYPYLVMELLSGTDLAHFLATSGPLSKAQALPIFLQVAEALQAAHREGVVHRDLKPANIFLCDNGPFSRFVKVLDFGIAKVMSPGSALQTGNSALLGTPAYMAPEQALAKNAQIDARTDQFALAAILYEMLSGQSPFFRAGDATFAILTRVVHEHPAPLLDDELWPVILRALSKDPDQRFPTLREFIEATGAQELTASIPLLELNTRPILAKHMPSDSRPMSGNSATNFAASKSVDQKDTRSRLLPYGGLTLLSVFVTMLALVWGRKSLRPVPHHPPRGVTTPPVVPVTTNHQEVDLGAPVWDLSLLPVADLALNTLPVWAPPAKRAAVSPKPKQLGSRPVEATQRSVVSAKSPGTLIPRVNGCQSEAHESQSAEAGQPNPENAKGCYLPLPSDITRHLVSCADRALIKNQDVPLEKLTGESMLIRHRNSTLVRERYRPFISQEWLTLFEQCIAEIHVNTEPGTKLPTFIEIYFGEKMK